MIDEENQSYEVEQDEVNYNESTEDVKITDGKIIYFFLSKTTISYTPDDREKIELLAVLSKPASATPILA